MDSASRWNSVSHQEYWASLALKHSKVINPRLLCQLLARFGSAYEVYTHVLNTPISEMAKWKLSKTDRWFPEKVKNILASQKWREPAQLEWNRGKLFAGDIILWTDYRYPLGLKRIPDAPSFFYTIGNTELLSYPAIAIVGARKCHKSSLEKAKEIAYDLALSGICVISGLARGVDSVAHEGALQCEGRTIAVLGSGLDIVYPPENKELFEKIKQNGLLVSEFALGTPPKAENFPIRNRIISGLSEGVLIVEAALRSGSLLTARLALEQNRNVYALKPESEEYSQGCLQLLDDGAHQVENALDIIRDITPQLYTEYLTKKDLLEEDTPRNLFQSPDDRQALYLEQNLLTQTEGDFSLDVEKDFFSGQTISEFPKQQARIGDNLVSLSINFAELSKTIMGTQDYPTVLVKKKKKKKIVHAETLENTSPKIRENTPQGQYQDCSHKQENANKTSTLNATKSEQISIDALEKETGFTSDINTEGWDILAENQRAIVYLLKERGSLCIDDLMANLAEQFKDIAELSTSLLMLEISGHVIRLPGTFYELAHSGRKK